MTRNTEDVTRNLAAPGAGKAADKTKYNGRGDFWVDAAELIADGTQGGWTELQGKQLTQPENMLNTGR